MVFEKGMEGPALKGVHWHLYKGEVGSSWLVRAKVRAPVLPVYRLSGSAPIDAWGRGEERIRQNPTDWGLSPQVRVGLGCAESGAASLRTWVLLPGLPTSSQRRSLEATGGTLPSCPGQGAQWGPVPVEARNILGERKGEDKNV